VLVGSQAYDAALRAPARSGTAPSQGGGVVMPSRLFGVRKPGAVSTFETFLGASVDLVLGFCDSTSWAGVITKANDDVTQYGTGKPIAWSVPLAVPSVSTLAQVAAGAGDSTYDALADIFLAARTTPSEPIFVRIGWEMFGGYYSWDAEGFEADYIAAFQRCVGRFRAKSSRFKFCFCPTWFQRTSPGNVNVPYGQVWPGDSYVDICGMDTYLVTAFDQSSGQTASQVWSNKLSAANGMNYLVAFGVAHNKPLALWEWGVDVDNAAAYADGVGAWVRANNVVFHAYFDRDTKANHQNEISDGTYPASGLGVKAQFGPITITSNANRYAAQDQQVALTLSASKTVSWSIVSADSAGFSIVGQTLVVATSVALGVHNVTVKATDERGLTATQAMTVDMRATLPLWTPAVLGSAVVDWYDAADLTSITKDGSDLVSKITSQKGNGRSFDQGSGAAKPTWRATGRNGRPTLQFDGGDSMTQAVVTSTPNGQSALCMFALAYADPALATFRYFMSIGDATGGSSNAISLGNGSNQVRFQPATGPLSTSTWQGLDRSVVVSVPAGASPTATLSVDGNTPVTGATTIGAFTTSRVVIGAQAAAAGAVGNIWTGHLALWGWLNRVLTASEFAQFEGWMSWAGGLAGANLPIGHSCKNGPPTVTDA